MKILDAYTWAHTEALMKFPTRSYDEGDREIYS